MALGPLRRLWQKHLLTLVAAEFGELNDLVSQSWTDYPEGFYAEVLDANVAFKEIIEFLRKKLHNSFGNITTKLMRPNKLRWRDFQLLF